MFIWRALLRAALSKWELKFIVPPAKAEGCPGALHHFNDWCRRRNTGLFWHKVYLEQGHDIAPTKDCVIHLQLIWGINSPFFHFSASSGLNPWFLWLDIYPHLAPFLWDLTAFLIPNIRSSLSSQHLILDARRWCAAVPTPSPTHVTLLSTTEMRICSMMLLVAGTEVWMWPMTMPMATRDSS